MKLCLERLEFRLLKLELSVLRFAKIQECLVDRENERVSKQPVGNVMEHEKEPGGKRLAGRDGHLENQYRKRQKDRSVNSDENDSKQKVISDVSNRVFASDRETAAESEKYRSEQRPRVTPDGQVADFNGPVRRPSFTPLVVEKTLDQQHEHVCCVDAENETQTFQRPLAAQRVNVRQSAEARRLVERDSQLLTLLHLHSFKDKEPEAATPPRCDGS